MALEIKFASDHVDVTAQDLSILLYEFELKPADATKPIIRVNKLYDDYLSDTELALLINQLRFEHHALAVYLISIVRIV